MNLYYILGQGVPKHFCKAESADQALKMAVETTSPEHRSIFDMATVTQVDMEKFLTLVPVQFTVADDGW